MEKSLEFENTGGKWGGGGEDRMEGDSTWGNFMEGGIAVTNDKVQAGWPLNIFSG